jgi:hypothetical protein
MNKLLVLAGVVGVMALADQDTRADLVAGAAHWTHKIIFEAIPASIITAALFVPWVMLFLAIKRNGTLGTVAATLAIAILANVSVGYMKILFFM